MKIKVEKRFFEKCFEETDFVMVIFFFFYLEDNFIILTDKKCAIDWLNIELY